MRHRNKYITLCWLAAMAIVVQSCSTTKVVPDGDQLYTGLSKIQYQNYEAAMCERRFLSDCGFGMLSRVPNQESVIG